MPVLSVVQEEEEKVTLAPLAGAPNETVMPETGALLELSTLTTRGAARPLPTSAVWPLPEDAEIEVGGRLMMYAAVSTGESWPFKLATAWIVSVEETAIEPLTRFEEVDGVDPSVV